MPFLFRPIRALVPFLVLAAALPAQEPQQDSRNTDIPDTKTQFTFPEFRSVAEWENHKQHLRQQILWSAGLVPMPPKPAMHAEIFGRFEGPDYTIEKVLLETYPGFYLGGSLFRPKTSAGKHPGILHPQGHWQYGRLENQPLYSGPMLGVSLARQGYVTFAWDMVGYTDTIQVPHDYGHGAQQLWSFTPLGLQLWNSIRALDFMQSLPDVDAQRIGITGASGGATQTFLLTAVDDRIQWSAPVNMVSAVMQGGDVCENVAGLRLGTNNMEFAAAFAPKPMLMVFATGDWTRDSPKLAFPPIQKIYGLYGRADNVNFVQINEQHNYNRLSREAVYRFFGKAIANRADAATITEARAVVPKLQDMLALSARSLPSNALSFDAFYDAWKEMSRTQTAAENPAQLREGLGGALATEWPNMVVANGSGERVYLTRPGVRDRVPAILIPGRGEPVLVVTPEGSDATRKGELGAKLARSGRPVLFLDAFQTGAAVAPRNREPQYFLTFNRSDDQNRVQDILTALYFLQTKYRGSVVEFQGTGEARTWLAYAAAVAPVPVKLGFGLDGLPDTDSDYLSRFMIPGIQRAGGSKALHAVLRSAIK